MAISVLNCVATIIASVAAAVSVFISYMSIKEANEQRQADQIRHKQQEWYLQLILLRLVPELEEFVASSNMEIDRCRKKGEMNLKKNFMTALKI